MAKPAAQFITPEARGARRLELQHPLFDEEAIARADSTLDALSASLEEWLDIDIAKLQTIRREAEANGWRIDSLDRLMSAAHDLKGMGATYGFPLATRLAASLCRLIETDAGKALAQRDPQLVCAHVDALRAAVRERLRDERHPVARALLNTLETSVAALGVAPT